MTIIQMLAAEFHLGEKQVENTVGLIDEGNTIPFIARYRKEVTGSLDDQVLRELAERLTYLRNLEEQRDKVRAVITEQGAMTDEIEAALAAAATLAEVEDIYRPFRPKRKTRASVAKEKGLAPLADRIYAQEPHSPTPLDMAADYIDEDKGVATAEEALQGAMDIIAETVSDDGELRKRLRNLFRLNAALVSKATSDEESVYEMYRDFREPVNRAQGHRVLAINRGERENMLKVSIEMDRVKALFAAERLHLKNGSPCTETVRDAIADAYDRLIFPSIEREIRGELTEQASTAAIKVFSSNLRQLLMQPPIKGKITLGLDPGYRNGCKWAVVDATGAVLDTGVIYPTVPYKREKEAADTVRRLIDKYGVEVFAIGNGTATHETEVFVADLIHTLPDKSLAYMVVSEAGASVYSASKLAAAEFPDFDVNVRSAVSIARRMQDPLAELVKIDPKAIGVGQYQHDMPPKQLSEALDGVVEDCVNAVGVDVNTASAPLLERVAGINASVAQNIVKFREENGAFTARTQLKKVPKLGAKAFEQAAGFLRVPESKNLLDRTAVHPESYAATQQLFALCDLSPSKWDAAAAEKLRETAEQKGLDSLAAQIGIGVPTLRDILDELGRPGRDPRDELPPPLLRREILGIEDLKPGMELKGTVRNVIDFGAFVDIGVHQDGLVHISQITNRFIKHPSEVLKVGDVVTVWVIAVDRAKQRISLTMKQPKE